MSAEEKAKEPATSLNVKAQKWQTYLKEQKITCFQSRIGGDGKHTVVFRALMEINGHRLPFLIYTDDSIYIVVKVLLAEAGVTVDNKPALLEYMDEMNRSYKLFKYATSPENDVELLCCLLYTEEGFDPSMVQTAIDLMMSHLIENYSALMRVIWTGENKPQEKKN